MGVDLKDRSLSGRQQALGLIGGGSSLFHLTGQGCALCNQRIQGIDLLATSQSVTAEAIERLLTSQRQQECLLVCSLGDLVLIDLRHLGLPSELLNALTQLQSNVIHPGQVLSGIG